MMTILFHDEERPTYLSRSAETGRAANQNRETTITRKSDSTTLEFDIYAHAREIFARARSHDQAGVAGTLFNY
jgi:hypothetical protein